MAEDEYRERRDFRKTPEPRGQDSAEWGNEGQIFVVHEHGASSHHYDFRIRVGDVLKSWAVPKGPSTDPREKRLAIQVEDHPLDYSDFEGVIPEDEYGAGPVIVWDRGPFRNITTDENEDPLSLEEAIKKGEVSIWLEGEKLKGGYVLVHARFQGKDENWLLVKRDDDEADARRNPVSTEPKSVKSGQTLQEIEEQEGTDND